MRFKAPIAEDIFLNTLSICTDNVRWQSICNPKDLAECTLLISRSSILGAVHMSRASPANRADSIPSRPMVT